MELQLSSQDKKRIDESIRQKYNKVAISLYMLLDGDDLTTVKNWIYLT